MRYEQFRLLAEQNNVIIDLLSRLVGGGLPATGYQKVIEEFEQRIERYDPEGGRQE